MWDLKADVMAELVVAGPEPLQRWRRPLPVGQVIRVGRAPRSGWAVPWDPLVSREHADLLFDNGKLTVRCLQSARNPVYFQERVSSEFMLSPGEHFRIGKTLFRLAEIDFRGDMPSPMEERSYHPEELSHCTFRDAGPRLEVLARLPRSIAESLDDEDSASRLVTLLLDAIPAAQAAAVVQYGDDLTSTAEPVLIRWDSRSSDMEQFAPSRRLMIAALQRGEGVLHVWDSSKTSKTADSYTVSDNLDWAFCMPFSEEACRGWCLYVSGQFGLGTGSVDVASADDLKEDMRFAGLLSQFIGSIRQARLLERRQAGLSQFFSPAVMEMLRHNQSARLLEPKETDITVLFCDVRGFARQSEQAQQNLKELLNRVSRALGVMTCAILKYDGVIADFQGDAALGFWGWPTSQSDGPLLACRAALEIQAEFARANQDESNPLAGFNVGIGIAYGRAIAGQIGTAEQIKVGVFGPVVNMGARLESMTKTVRSPILIDERSAEYVRDRMPPSVGQIRRLGRIRPYGMDTAIAVSELLPPADVEGTLTDQHIASFEAAVDAMEQGQWNKSLELLGELPVHDRTKDFLMIYIATNNYAPPAGWDGVVQMRDK